MRPRATPGQQSQIMPDHPPCEVGRVHGGCRAGCGAGGGARAGRSTGDGRGVAVRSHEAAPAPPCCLAQLLWQRRCQPPPPLTPGIYLPPAVCPQARAPNGQRCWCPALRPPRLPRLPLLAHPPRSSHSPFHAALHRRCWVRKRGGQGAQGLVAQPRHGARRGDGDWPRGEVGGGPGLDGSFGREGHGGTVPVHGTFGKREAG